MSDDVKPATATKLPTRKVTGKAVKAAAKAAATPAAAKADKAAKADAQLKARLAAKGKGTTNGKPNAPKKGKAKPADAPGHYTANGNKKHQCNGPAAWGPVFLAAARKELGQTAREGDGVRMALAIGMAELVKRHGLKAPTGSVDPRQTSIPAVAK